MSCITFFLQSQKMGKKALRAKHPDRLYNIALRVKGSLKNEILAAAKRNNMTLAEYILYCTWEHMRSERGIPPPGTAQFSLPEPMDVVRSYFTGETVLQPCGKQKCDIQLVEFQGMTFCDTCNVRIE